MTFFRIKKIKGKEYIYMVENEWTGKSSRQKVKGYLGKAFRFDMQRNIEFTAFWGIQDIERYIDENKKEKIMKDLIEWEIARNWIPKEKFIINPDNKKIQ